MSRPVTEIAVYKIKPEASETFAGLRSRAMDHLRTWPGFISESFLSSPADPVLFTDILIWQSEEDFGKAMERAGSDPELAGFLSVMAESVYFGHFHSDSK
ncbi:MAG: antibiotic biosynthesis monooxygenase [Bacteroidetes bacterium]|nr:antibiotic biosynthesis monooxygenase [Bacteroidota bacterium]